MLKVASVFAVQASAQYPYSSMPAPTAYAQTYQDVAHTFHDVYAPQLHQPMYGNQFGAQPIYNQPQYTDYGGAYPQPVMLQPQYATHDGAFAQPVMQPIPDVNFGAPQFGMDVNMQGKAEVPHPDEVKKEQVQYLQQAQENLDKQKQAQKDELQQEKERITQELQRQSDEAFKGAEQRYEERLANLDRNAEEYTRRLDAQTNELRVKYCQNQVQDRFSATEATITQQERFANEEFQQAYNSGNPALHQVQQQILSTSVQRVHAERQENLRRLQQDFELLGRGGIPAACEAVAEEPLAEEPLAEGEYRLAEDPPAEDPPADEPLAEGEDRLVIDEDPPAEEVAEASPEEALN